MADDGRQSAIRNLSLTSGMFFTLVVVIVIGLFWCLWSPGRCPFCKKCENDCAPAVCIDCPPFVARIVLEDSHSGVWMTTDNGFIDPDKPPLDPPACVPPNPSLTRSCILPLKTTLTTGVLFQMGMLKGEGGNYDHFDGVKITFADNTWEEYAPGTFDWIDVNPVGAHCTIDAAHAYRVFGRPSTGTPNVFNRVPHGCDSETLSNPMTTANESCLRGRELHAAVFPDAAITYWAGLSPYYAVHATEPGQECRGQPGCEQRPTDTIFVFDLYDAVTVDVWNDGCLIENHTDVKEIRILFKGPSGHGKYHRPAMNG